MILTKAIIKQTYSKDNYYQVYIPLLRKAGDTEDSATLKATKICLPGISQDLKVGDIVYVGFEDTEYDRPVIFGKLFTLDDKGNDTVQTSKVLTVTDKAQLPGDTTIGDISLNDIINRIKGIDYGAGENIKIESNNINVNIKPEGPETETSASHKFTFDYKGDGSYLLTYNYLVIPIAIYHLTTNQIYKYSGPGILDDGSNTISNLIYDVKISNTKITIESSDSNNPIPNGLTGNLFRIPLY